MTVGIEMEQAPEFVSKECLGCWKRAAGKFVYIITCYEVGYTTDFVQRIMNGIEFYTKHKDDPIQPLSRYTFFSYVITRHFISQPHLWLRRDFGFRKNFSSIPECIHYINTKEGQTE